MTINQQTSLARPLDFNYSSNVFIVGAGIVAFIAGSIVQIVLDNSVFESIKWGFQAGFSVFIAWALNREIDPDYPPAAIVAAMFQVLLLLISAPGSILFSFLIMTLTRIISRTSGITPSWIDGLGIFILAALISFLDYPIAGIIASLGFAFDAFLIKRNAKSILFSILSAIAGLVSFILIFNNWGSDDIDGIYKILTPIVALLFCIKLISTKQVATTSDNNNYKLDAIRVQASQFIALTAGISLFWIYGSKGFDALSSVWSAMAGSGVYLIFRLIRRIFRK